MSELQYKSPNITFLDDVAFTKGDTDDTFIYDIPKLDSCEFDDYNSFSTSPTIGPLIPNYVYTAARQLISSVLDINDIVACRWINSLSGRNCSLDVNKLRKLFLFNPGNIVMKTLEANTQLGGFNQCLPMRQSKISSHGVGLTGTRIVLSTLSSHQ